MKYFFTFILFFFLIIKSVSAYNLTEKDILNLTIFKGQVINIFDKDVSKAYNFNKNLDTLLFTYKKNTKNYSYLEYIKDFTSNYISNYEKEILESIEKEKNYDNSDNNKEEDNSEIILNDYYVLNIEAKTISKFTIEPRHDNIYLKNIYLKNIWTLSNMDNLFEKLYLVDSENKIISNWYVDWEYLFFNVIWDYILEKDKLNNLFVKTTFKEITNQTQTWELKFELSTPNNWLQWTFNGVRATSYSNWNYITSNVEILDPIVTFISYTSWVVESNKNFTPNYSEILEFKVNNNWNRRLDLENFQFSIYGSFLNNIDLNSEIVLRIKWTNQEFWRAKLSEIQNSILTINHTWNAFNFISWNSSTNYILEIVNIWNPTWSREIRLNNMVIWDWFWWLINNLNDYSNTWLPSEYSIYRY